MRLRIYFRTRYGSTAASQSEPAHDRLRILLSRFQGITYQLIDVDGNRSSVEHRRHSFETGRPFPGQGTGQRYERVLQYMSADTHSKGVVGKAVMHVLEAQPMWSVTSTHMPNIMHLLSECRHLPQARGSRCVRK